MIRALIVLCLLAIPAAAQTRAELRDALLAHEGYNLTPYLYQNQWHVGVGHRLPAEQRWRRWTHAQVETAFAEDLTAAYRAARAEIPSYDSHPVEVKIVLVELAFQCGRTGLRDFVEFRKMIAQHRYISAARELRRSKLARQAPSRVEGYVTVLTRAAFRLP